MKTKHSFLAGIVSALLLVGLLIIPAGGKPSSPQTLGGPPVAFSAQATDHLTSGQAAVMDYATTVSNVGGYWDGSDTFTVPTTGPYFFSLEFQKVSDSFYNAGTNNDVYMYIASKDGGPWTNRARAWAGEGTNRATGAVSTVLYLHQGAKVRTTAFSDGSPPELRWIPTAYFSGFLIK